ncbi:MAG TPA: DUF350 domain-containing protein [Thermoanaerobaculia bacterium]|nr:DUF350 domain-containing protein [Thermoanaerobaculia bacterium]
MPEFDVFSILAGIVAYVVAGLGSVLLVFVLFRWSSWGIHEVREEDLKDDHRPVAVALGATLLSEALLLRHAVFPIMAVIRDLFVGHASWGTLGWVLAQSALFFVAVGTVSVGSIFLADRLFNKLTGKFNEHEEIKKGNMAVAIFYAFVLLAITAILNEGIEDLSRSLIPYGDTGIIRLQ